MTRHNLTIKERLLDNCIPEPNSGCWLWLGSLRGKGKHRRPQLKVGQTNKNGCRLSYKTFICEPIDGFVLHKCDNGFCINPEHLFAGTHQDNMTDMMVKGRHVAPKGEKNGVSKLKDCDVIEIRKRLKQGVLGVDLAKQYNVSNYAISLIKLGKSWKHLL